VKGDAVIRVPRPSWKKARDFAARVGRELREVTGTALVEYVEREAGKPAKKER
jgi:hypothetical protein